MSISWEFLSAALTAIGAAAASWAAVRTELRYMRRDIDDLNRRVYRMEKTR